MLLLTEIIKPKGESEFKYKPILVNPHNILIAQVMEHTPEVGLIDEKTKEIKKPILVTVIVLYGTAQTVIVQESLEQIGEMVKVIKPKAKMGKQPTGDIV